MEQAWHWKMSLRSNAKRRRHDYGRWGYHPLGKNHFHVTTTTGGAAGVLDWMEEWLQTNVDSEVYLTSVTEQWSVATLSGPNAAKSSKLDDIDLSPANFPFMSMKNAILASCQRAFSVYRYWRVILRD